MNKLRALTMPKWGIEMVEGTLSEWHIGEGERIEKGQLIAVVETEKIANDLEAEYEATAARLVATPSNTYPVGALLAVLANEPATATEVDEFVRTFRAAAGSPAALAQPPMDPVVAMPRKGTVTVSPDTAMSPAARRLAAQRSIDVGAIQGSGRRGRITLQDVHQWLKPKAAERPRDPVSVAVSMRALDGCYASPYAKRLAVRHSVDLCSLQGTGPHGRISRVDVLRAAGIAPAPIGCDQTPKSIERFSPMRKAIARQLTLSKSTIPHFYLRMSVRLEAVLALREQAKASGAAPSINDYLVRAVALALMEVPAVNIQVHDEAIRRFEHADIAVAVATDRGLITPVVRAAETKSVDEIAVGIRKLAERARTGKLRNEDISGGTFSVSNLGMYGVDEFDAIINPPQGAILAIGAAKRRAVEENGSFKLATTAHLSLSCDHRAIDGAVGAQFLAVLRELIEQPVKL